MKIGASNDQVPLSYKIYFSFDFAILWAFGNDG